MIKTSHLGFVIVLFTILLGTILYTFSMQEMAMSTQQCEAELNATVCPHQGFVPPQTFLGALFLIGLGSIGVFLVFQKEQAKISFKSKIDLKSLDEEEKAICKNLLGSNGVMFQADLIEKTGLSKVKITRVLDKMEAKSLIERRRRGMSNIVMVKQ